jgi:osmoprotectant transport system substrate-binding protein
MSKLRACAVLAVLAMAAACADQTAEPEATPAPKEGPAITVGSADFSESVILAEIYAQALAAEGYTVDTKLNVGSRELTMPAMERGEIDFMPEYTGNLLRFITGEEAATGDADETYGKLTDVLDGKPFTVLEQAQAEDKDSIVVTKETADRYELETVSDLKDHAGELTFGGPPECPERPACLKGLREVYELEFKDTKSLDAAGPLTVAALDGGEVQVALLFSTQAVIADKGWVVLEDDKNISAAQNIVPLVRNEIVDGYGDEFESFVNGITAKITTDGLTELNKLADVDKEDPDAVARDWLVSNELLEA